MLFLAGRFCTRSTHFILALHFLLRLAHAQSAPAGNKFINPPAAGEWFDYSENRNYLIGDVIDLQWQTKFAETTLAIFQQNNSTATPLVPNPQTSTSFQWTVDVNDFNLENGNIFFFWVYDGKLFDYKGYSFTSHYFNVVTDGDQTSNSAAASVSAAPATTEPATSILTVLSKTTLVGTPSSDPTSSAQSNAQASPTQASPSQTSPAAQSSSKASPNASDASPTAQSEGKSNTTKIAIGVGVGIGVSCLLIGIAAGLFLRRRSSKREKNAAAYFTADEKRQEIDSGTASYAANEHQHPIGELDATNRYGGYNELDARGKTHELGT